MAQNLYWATGLEGGAAGDLDTFPYASIQDEDAAVVADLTNQRIYFYTWDAGVLNGSQSLPDYIEPDDNGANNGAWTLCDIMVDDADLKVTKSLQIIDAGGTDITDVLNSGSSEVVDDAGDDDTLMSESCVVYYATNTKGLDRVLSLAHMSGVYERPKFAWKDADEIYITGGWWHHDGAASGEQILYNNSTITFQFTNGTGAGMIYLYLDDSDVISSPLAAGDLIDSETAPTYSHSLGGWYNGEDRCIGAFYQSAANTLVEFYHNGGEWILFHDYLSIQSAYDLDGTFEDTSTLYAPACQSDMTGGWVDLQFLAVYVNAIKYIQFRTNTLPSSLFHGFTAATQLRNIFYHVLPLDDNNVVEWRYNADCDETASLFQHGYSLPGGM